MESGRCDVDDRLLSVVKEELFAPEAIAEVQRLVLELSSSAECDKVTAQTT